MPSKIACENEIATSVDHTINHIFIPRNIDMECQNLDMKMKMKIMRQTN